MAKKPTLAEKYLSKIAALDEELPSFGSLGSGQEISPFPSPKRKTYAKLAPLDNNVMVVPDLKPLKVHEKPVSSVRSLINAKETETVQNNATDFKPMPDSNLANKSKSIFITKPAVNLNNNFVPKMEPIPGTEAETEKLTKSEMGRMGKINTVMSASPSMKTLLVAKVQPNSNTKSSAMRSWIDSDRDNLRLASFVCRMLEIKRWCESILGESIGLEDYEIDKFPDYLTNGVLICRIAQKFDPDAIKKVYTSDGNNTFDNVPDIYLPKRRDFKFIQNIGQFLSFTTKIKLPKLFCFETNDLYEMNDIPKVIGCLHALACMLAISSGTPTVTRIEKMELCSISEDSFGIDKMKSINYKIGRNLPGKYLSGFDEAVRVNLGDDIRNLKLVAVEPTPTATNDKSDNNELSTSTNIENDGVDHLTSDIMKEADMTLLRKVPSNTSSVSSVSSIDSPITPPSEENIVEARRARAFFNAPIPRSATLPKLDSMTSIHNKYKYMLSEDEQALLKGLNISKFKPSDQPLNEVDERIMIQFQALARGKLLRFENFVNKFMLKSNTADIIQFQSICRGVLQRNEIAESSSNLLTKNRLYRTRRLPNTSSFVYLKRYEKTFTRLQAISRGKLIRDKIWLIRKTLMRAPVTGLQAYSKGKLVRELVQEDLPHIKIKPIKPFQYDEDYELFESFDANDNKPHASSSSPSYKSHHLITRSEYKRQHAKLEPNLPLVSTPFSASSLDQFVDLTPSTPPDSPKPGRTLSKLHHSPTKKGKLNTLLPPLTSKSQDLLFKSRASSSSIDPKIKEQLNIHEKTIESLQSVMRTKLAQLKIEEIHDHLYKTTPQIISLLSTYRAIETRFEVDCILLDMKDREATIVDLQALARGFSIRQKIKKRHEWFLRKDNLVKIIKLQAFIKGKREQLNYKSLIDSNNPPFNAISKFANLLSGGEGERVIRDSMAVMEKKEQCKLQRIKLKGAIEQLKQAKMKYEILKSNGVKLRNLGLIKFEHEDDKDDDETDDMKLSGICKEVAKFAKIEEDKLVLATNSGSSSRKETELVEFYGKLFWTLQTDLKYWTSVVLELMRGDIEVQFSHGHLEDWILKCFNFNELNNQIDISREEFQVMSLIKNVLKEVSYEMKANDFKMVVKDRRDLEYENIKLWELILMAYTNQSQQRDMTKKKFGEIVFLVTGDDEAYFECDPDVILDDMDLDVEADLLPGQDSIDNPEVKGQYIKNLKSLKNTTVEILNKLSAKVGEVPVYLRCLLREIFEMVRREFNDVSSSYWYGFVGSIFMKDYLLPMLLKPGNYSIDIYSLSDDYHDIERIQRNLDLVSIMLLQSVLMKPFSASQCAFLIPLNSFITSNADQVKKLLDNIMDVPSMEQVYQKVSLTHMIPQLKIKVDDLIELTNIWGQFLEQFFSDEEESNGKLFQSLSGLAQYDNVHRRPPASDSYGYIELNLVEEINQYEGISDDSQLKAMWLELKRYLTYILQIQSGKDLIDVLLKSIEPKDEINFLELIKSERSILQRRGIKVKDEVYKLPFPLVKERAIGLINELEDMGLVDYKDGYQTILNELARDIKHRKAQREQIENETKSIVDILTDLKRKTATYDKRAKEYDLEINSQLDQMVKTGSAAREEGNSNKKSSFFKRLFRSSLRAKAHRGGVKLSSRQLVDSGAFSGREKASLEVRYDTRNHEFTFELNNGLQNMVVALDTLVKWQYMKERVIVLGLQMDSLRLSQLVIKQFFRS